MGKIKAHKKDINDIQQTNIIVFASVVALLFTVIVCCLLTFYPDFLDVQWITDNLVYDPSNFVSENSEKMQYVLGTIVFVSTYFMTSFFVKNNKILFNVNLKPARDILLLGFVVLSTVVLLKEDIYLSNLPPALLRWNVIWFVVILIISIANIRIVTDENSRTNEILLLILGVISIAIVSSLYLRETYFYGVANIEHHANAYFYPIWKIWCGQYPLVDFACLYGYYPYFFVGVMAMLGGVTESKFCVIIAVLMAVIFVSLFYVLWQTCKNKFWAFVGLLSIECVLCMYNAELTGEYYLQYYPHRMITLCLLLALCCKFIKYKQEKKRYSKGIEVAGWMCAGFALLWNLDTGVVVWLGWTIYLIFLYLLEQRLFTKQTGMFIVKTVLKCIFTAVLSFVILLVLTYILSGRWIGFQELFFGQSIFYSSGFFMIRMVLWHPWLIVMFIYALGIVISLAHMKDIILVEKKYDVIRIAMYFVMAVVGVGAFLYYQGRSHNHVFVAIVWPAIMLIVLLVDNMSIRGKKPLKFKILSKVVWHTGFSVLASILLTFAVGWCYYLSSPDCLINQKDRNNVGSSVVQREIDVINAKGLEINDLDLLTEYSAEVYERLGVRYIPNVQSEVDIFTWQHVKDIQEYLRNTRKNVVIDMKMKNFFVANDEHEFTTILENRFNVEEYNGYLICRQKAEGGAK